MQPISRQQLNMIFALAALCVYGAHFVPYIYVTHPDAIYMDSLQLLVLYDEVKRGLPIADTWGRLSGVHRGLIAQSYAYLNAELFGYSVIGANLASGFVLTATALMLAAATPLHRAEIFDTQRVGVMAMIALSGVILISMFSLASFELFTFDYGLVLFVKNFVLLAFWLSLGRVLRPTAVSAAAILTACIAGGAIVLLVAMGWSYAFVAACAVLVLDAWWLDGKDKAIARRGCIVLAALCASLFVYATAGGGVNALAGFSGHESDQILRMGNVVGAVLLGFSSVFIGNEAADLLRIPPVAQGAAGVLLLSTMLAVFVARRHRFGPRHGLPYALMAYASACIVAVAVARGRVDPSFARASRYFMDFSLLIIGLCWAAWYGPRAVSPGLRRWQVGTALLAAACCGLFLIGQALTHGIEWWKAPSRGEVFAAMRQASLCGITGQSDVSLLQATSRDVAERAISIQSARGIGVLREPAAARRCPADDDKSATEGAVETDRVQAARRR